MARPHRRDPDKERFWRTLLELHSTSGLSVRDFCQQHHISEANFYAWRREIRLRDQEPTSKPQTTPPFVPIQILPSQSDLPPLEILLRSGHTLKLRDGFDPHMLRLVLDALEERA